MKSAPKKKPEASAGASIPELRVTITKTADGQREYVQLISSDQLTINVVLVADCVVVQDARS